MIKSFRRASRLLYSILLAMLAFVQLGCDTGTPYRQHFAWELLLQANGFNDVRRAAASQSGSEDRELLQTITFHAEVFSGDMSDLHNKLYLSLIHKLVGAGLQISRDKVTAVGRQITDLSLPQKTTNQEEPYLVFVHMMYSDAHSHGSYAISVLYRESLFADYVITVSRIQSPN